MREKNEIDAIMFLHDTEESKVYEYHLTANNDCTCETCESHTFQIRLETNPYEKGALRLIIGEKHYEPSLFPTIRNIRQLGMYVVSLIRSLIYW